MSRSTADAGSVTLDGAWELSFAVNPRTTAATPDELASRTDYQRVAATVPGNVELDLRRAGLIPDPFVGDNLQTVTGYELADWWLVRDVDWPGTPADHDAVAVFEGLDTFAEIFCNGHLVGSTANMLIPHEIDLTDAIRPGSNRIAVHLRSPLVATDEAGEESLSAGMVGHEERMEMLRARRAPHTYGWDIAPRLLSAGIWRPARIVARPRTRIAEHYLTTRALTTGPTGEVTEATLDLWFRIAGWPWDSPVDLQLTLTAPDGATIEEQIPLHFRAGHHEIVVPEPVLWWPRGYGDAALYDLQLRLVVDDQVIDTVADRAGLRTAELMRRPGTTMSLADHDLDHSDDDEDFRVVINGTEVFCSGTNWVPLDALHSRDAERLPAALALLDEVGGNLVRCWGGNVYESDAFFAHCDEQGLLVWQDIALACGITPQDESFAEQLRTEATVTAQRLRQHPCLLLWCGNNENDMFWAQRGFDPAHDRISREVLRDTLFAHDPVRPYVPSSPFYTTRNLAAGVPRAEDHLWGVRARFKAPFYAAHGARFVSEIGYHGAPSLRALRAMTGDPQATYDPEDPVQRLHATEAMPARYHRSYNRIRLMIEQAQLHVDFDLDDPHQLVQASQITQAEAFKFFVEQARLTPGRTGIVWWNLLDGWPQISDAVVGHDLERKLAFHFLRRSQEPVVLVADEAHGWERPVLLVNHTNQAVRVVGAVRDLSTAAVLWSGEAAAPAGGVVEVVRVPIARAADTMLALTWELPDAPSRTTGANHYLDVAGRVDLTAYLRWLTALAPLIDLPLDRMWPR